MPLSFVCTEGLYRSPTWQIHILELIDRLIGVLNHICSTLAK